MHSLLAKILILIVIACFILSDRNGYWQLSPDFLLLNETTGLNTQQTSAISNTANIRLQGLEGRYTQMVDATGIRILKEVNAEIKKRGGKLIISEVISEQVLEELKKTRLLFQIRKANVTPTLEKALERMHEILHK